MYLNFISVQHVHNYENINLGLFPFNHALKKDQEQLSNRVRLSM